MQILIVDDDDINLAMLERILTDSGHEVVSARNGKEALEVLQKDLVRMVISDWVMPGMDGIELCQKIRSGLFPAYIYIILLTSKTAPADLVRGLSSGADEFISKPFNPNELLVRVRTGERILSLETRHVAIFAMAKLAESRDPETGLHLERMRSYCQIAAQHLMQRPEYATIITPEYIQTLFLTSPLHDIGKVGIPDYVLLKPSRLTNEEFEIMKAHTLIGASTLTAAVEQYPNVEYLRMARDVALTHHERFDGKGYPQGLEEEDIPLCGHIVALADVYDALTSRRVYKAAMPHDIAKSIIVGDRGKHFAPDIVDAFLATEAEFITTKNRLSENGMDDKPELPQLAQILASTK